VFALFIVSVLMLFLISLFSFTQQQSQTASVRQKLQLGSLKRGNSKAGSQCRKTFFARGGQ
jgi:hypothetical protein